jgi:hypothetical protein
MAGRIIAGAAMGIVVAALAGYVSRRVWPAVSSGGE